MRTRGPLLSLCASLALALAACAAPNSQAPAAPAHPTQASESVDAPAAQANAPATAGTATGRDKLHKLSVRTGGPLPPQVLPATAAADRSCDSDADCVVATVAVCCNAGSATPVQACVNRHAAAGPAPSAQCTPHAAKSQCVTGEVRGCRCVAGSCIAQQAAIDPVVDPAPQPPEQR